MTLLDLEREKARETRKRFASNRYLRRHGRIVPAWTKVKIPLTPMFVLQVPDPVFISPLKFTIPPSGFSNYG